MRRVCFRHHFLYLHRLVAHRIHHRAFHVDDVSLGGALGNHHAGGHFIDPDVGVFLFALVVSADAHAVEGHLAIWAFDFAGVVELEEAAAEDQLALHDAFNRTAVGAVGIPRFADGIP